MTTLRVLSVRQPWAWAILYAGKDVENRTWRTPYRGRIAIHAGKLIAPGAADKLRGIGIEVPADLPRGAILGTIDVMDCVEGVDSRWAVPEHWHWQLANPCPLALPVPCNGSLWLWRAAEDLAEQVRSQLGCRAGRYRANRAALDTSHRPAGRPGNVRLSPV